MDTTTATQSITEPPTKTESVEAKNTPSLEGQAVSKSKPRSRVIRSRSKKSESDSKTSQSQESRPARKYWRSRILRRFFDVRAMEQKDMKYVYASYRLKNPDEKITPEDFEALFQQQTAHASHLWVVTDEYKGDDRPVAVFLQAGNSSRAFETHSNWMEWASPRDKLTAAITFAERMRRKQTIILMTGDKAVDRFSEQLRRYGVLRRVGTMQRYYPDKSDAYLWQSREW